MRKNTTSMQSSRRPKGKKTGAILATVLVVLLVVACVLYYKKHHSNNAKTTSTAKTAQNDYNDGRERPTNGGDTGTNQGGATDNKGGTQTTPGESSVTSDSGAITVKGLAKNDLLADGYDLHGTTTADVSTVQFRVIDDTVGVVAQGSLSVVDGVFSGTLHFSPKASSGRVDVFSFDSASSEINNIEIPVRFK